MTAPEWWHGEPLLPAELDLLHHAANGSRLSFPCHADTSLDDMRTWAPERTVRASVLRDLLVDERNAIHAKGVRLRGARINGQLDFEYAQLHWPLELDMCYLDSGKSLNLAAATAPALTLTQCHLSAGLAAEDLTVEYALNLSGSRFGGPCYLNDARIRSQLDLSSAHLTGTNQDGYALAADRINVTGGMFLTNASTTGSIRLLEADIKGQLALSDAQLNGTDQHGNALVADGITVTGAMFLTNASTTGSIRLLEADIKGPLALSDAQLNGTDQHGNALVADGITVSGAMFLTNASTTTGAIRLPGADIKGQLALSGANLIGIDQHGKALIADGMRVGGDVFLDSGFVVKAAVSMSEARVEGALLLTEAQLDGQPVALRADGARVGHELGWSPTLPVQGVVNLERAAIHRLDDQWGQHRPAGHWPPAGKLRLNGFTYHGFGGTNQASPPQRLDWIRKSHTTSSHGKDNFQSQPYEQLARVYREAGQDAEARQVAIARRTDLRKHGHLTRGTKAVNWMLDVTIRHGYKPGRALWALLVLYLAAFTLLWHAQHQDDLIVPTATTELTPAPAAPTCTATYPCYYPAGHAFDTVVPILSTGQTDHWRINAHAPAGTCYLVGAWVFTILGWAFTTLAVLGFTGIVRRD